MCESVCYTKEKVGLEGKPGRKEEEEEENTRNGERTDEDRTVISLSIEP